MRDPHVDTQDRIDEDAMKWFVQYWGCEGYLCRDCPIKIDGKNPYEFYQTNGCCDIAMSLDLVARQRELDREVY